MLADEEGEMFSEQLRMHNVSLPQVREWDECETELERILDIKSFNFVYTRIRAHDNKIFYLNSIVYNKKHGQDGQKQQGIPMPRIRGVFRRG